MEIVITLSDVGEKCLGTELLDIQAHFQELADHMVERILDKIYSEEVARMTADPEIDSIPANKEQVVLAAEILSAAERQAAIEAESAP